MMSEGELVLSFCDYEIVLHGINLRELWKDLRERRLARVWELPADWVERPKNYGQKKNWLAVGAEQILERVSEHFQSDLERLKERSIRNNLARRCAITLCWDHAGLSHDEIAALFRLPSSNSVAQTIRRTKTHDVQTLKVLKHQISHK